jgi:hypothetical protein
MPSYLVQGEELSPSSRAQRDDQDVDSRLALKRDKQRQGAEQVLRLRSDALIRQH